MNIKPEWRIGDRVLDMDCNEGEIIDISPDGLYIKWLVEKPNNRNKVGFDEEFEIVSYWDDLTRI